MKHFFISSPASNDSVVVYGGWFDIDIISTDACFRKLSILITGNGTTFGKNVIVSMSMYALVWGK